MIEKKIDKEPADIYQKIYISRYLILKNLHSSNEEQIYFSQDMVDENCLNMHIPDNFLNSIDQSGLPLHCLSLKTGFIIFLLRNINTSLGLCNVSVMVQK